eukprot:GFUD01003783.1.p1 GENE.GFUD01003783.1~~GFUD01003783.1.p1  ORF type:complete len:268 (+),score=85.87 GFUD01003783.1:190-993(+)
MGNKLPKKHQNKKRITGNKTNIDNKPHGLLKSTKLDDSEMNYSKLEREKQTDGDVTNTEINIFVAEKHKKEKIRELPQKEACKAEENLNPTAAKDSINSKQERLTKTFTAESRESASQDKGASICPSGFIIDLAKDDIEHENTKQSLFYIPGKSCIENPQTSYQFLDNHEQDVDDINDIEDTEDIDDTTDIDDTKDIDSCLPLTRILYKQVPGYSIDELDKAVIEILNTTNSDNLTIPQFKEIIMKKLETEFWPDGIYISDNDDEDE